MSLSRHLPSESNLHFGEEYKLRFNIVQIELQKVCTSPFTERGEKFRLQVRSTDGGQ
jgi:hypothetical protein